MHSRQPWRKLRYAKVCFAFASAAKTRGILETIKASSTGPERNSLHVNICARNLFLFKAPVFSFLVASSHRTPVVHFRFRFARAPEGNLVVRAIRIALILPSNLEKSEAIEGCRWTTRRETNRLEFLKARVRKRRGCLADSVKLRFAGQNSML